MIVLFANALVGVVLGIAASAPAVDYYTTKYEHIDIDAILNNRRLVNYYAACMLTRGPCPPEGLDFKRILPEALATNCERCTEKQKTVTLRSIKRLKKEYPKVWNQLEAIWDPKGIYVSKFINTFDKKSSPATTPGPVSIFNRFSDESDTNEIVGSGSENTSSSVAIPFSSSTTSTTNTRSTSTTTPSTTTPSTTTTRTTSTATNTINTVRPTTQQRPTAVVGNNLQATVSYGTNLVGGLVRGLGNLGIKVIGQGVQLTEMVLRGVQAVVRPIR